MSNPNPFVSDAEIEDLLKEEEYGETLEDALDSFVGKYLLEDGAEKYPQRRRSYDRSYVVSPPYAPWWKKLCHKFKKVEHPDNGEEVYLYEALAWFNFCARVLMYSELSRRSYMAFGFLSPRQYGDKRKPIPLDLWGEAMSSKGIDWGNSTVSNNGFSFVGVRIVDFSFQVLIDEELELSGITKKRAGRPSLKSEIKCAVEVLLQEGALVKGFVLSEKLGIIQDKVAEMYPNKVKGVKGMQYDAVRKVIVHHFPNHLKT